MKRTLKLKVFITISAFILVIGCKSGNTEQVSQDKTAPKTQSDAICDTLSNAGSDEVATDSTLAPVVQNQVLPRMLELGSVGCRPCEMMTPILDELRRDYAGKLSVEFYDVRKDPAPAQKYKIKLIPTQIFLDANGKEFFRHEGFYPKEEIVKVLRQAGIV